MEINTILGNYEPIDENWLGLVEGDDKTMIKLRSADKWLDEYVKITKKFTDLAISEQKIKTVTGNNRVIRVNNKTTEEKITPEQEEKQFKELRDFLIDNVIIDWKGIEENEVEIPFTKENALKVFDLNNAGTKSLVLTILAAAAKRENFTKASEYKLEDEETVKK